MFGFFEEIVNATVNVAISPVALVTDVIKGDVELTNTGKTLNNAVTHVEKAFD